MEEGIVLLLGYRQLKKSHFRNKSMNLNVLLCLLPSIPFFPSPLLQPWSRNLEPSVCIITQSPQGLPDLPTCLS